MDDHRMDAAERGGQLGERHRIDDRRPRLPTALDLEREHPAGDAVAELADGDVVLGMAGEAGIEDADHAVLTLEPRGECRGGARMALHPDPKAQDAPQHEERIERTDRPAGVVLDASTFADKVHPARDDAGDDVTVPAEELRGRLETRSAPSSIGRQTYGEAKVLSTM